jgi:GNAT superfamily N-acetyltransferase
MVVYDVFDARDGVAIARLLATAFSERDPPAVALGITATEFDTFVRLLAPKAATEALTIVARDSGTGEIVGALLTEDLYSRPADGIHRLSTTFEPILALLDDMQREYRQGRPAARGEYLHLFLLGVAVSYAGQGIGQQLVARTMEHGTSRGYTIAVTEATSRRSQHVFRSQGFVERVQRSYADYGFEGRRPFASIASEGGPILMDRSLEAR